MKETLSSKIWITMHDNESIYAKDVRGFIQDLKEEIKKEIPPLREGWNVTIKKVIDKLAGEELANTASPSAPSTSHSPHATTDILVDTLGKKHEDTRKGCLKTWGNISGEGFLQCGVDGWLCPACSNNKEARKLKKILLKEHKGANWSLAR